MKLMMFVLLLFLGIMHSVTGAKVLLLTAASTSHCMEKMSIGQELLKRGHHVTLYAILFDPQNCVYKFNVESFKPRFKTVIPNVDPSFKKIVDDVVVAGQKHIFARANSLFFLREIKRSLTAQCEAAFYDKRAIQELEDDKYDVAIVDSIPFAACLFSIPYVLGIPAVAEGALIDQQDSRMPLQSNTFPSFYTAYSNKMSFVQRCLNTMLSVLNPLVRMIIIPSIDLSQYNEKLRGIDAADLMKDSILFLENSDHIVDYPKALFPNFVEVGGLTAAPAKPLPADVKSFMDSAKEGVVLVTFGSSLRFFPEKLKDKLMTAFNQLNNKVIFKHDKEEIRGNVKTMKWLPQNDILGHPNTKLFVSHCGKNGFWESVYHGVPIICIAIHAETYITVTKVKKYGIGSSINLFDDTAQEMVDKIKDVLENNTITQNMKKISALFGDRSETPAQRAVSAIEHVIKYGGSHLRPPSANFGHFSYICVDVWVFIFMILILVISFDIWIIRKCCRRPIKSKSKTE